MLYKFSEIILMKKKKNLDVVDQGRIIKNSPTERGIQDWTGKQLECLIIRSVSLEQLMSGKWNIHFTNDSLLFFRWPLSRSKTCPIKPRRPWPIRGESTSIVSHSNGKNASQIPAQFRRICARPEPYVTNKGPRHATQDE